MGYSNRDTGERLAFLRSWANYIKRHENKVWSKQQNNLINSILKSADKSPELYSNVKKRMALGRFTNK